MRTTKPAPLHTIDEVAEQLRLHPKTVAVLVRLRLPYSQQEPAELVCDVGEVEGVELPTASRRRT